MVNKVPSWVTAYILEMADDMHRIGVMDDETYQRITVGHLGREALPTSVPQIKDALLRP